MIHIANEIHLSPDSVIEALCGLLDAGEVSTESAGRLHAALARQRSRTDATGAAILANAPHTTDDYEIHVNIGPQHYSTRGPSPNIGYRAYFSTCEISEGGGIAFSTDKADVLADLDLLVERVAEARRRVEELP